MTIIGKKIKLSFPHSTMATVSFLATVIKDEEKTFVVRIPERIRKLQWSPYTGKAYRFNKSDFSWVTK